MLDKPVIDAVAQEVITAYNVLASRRTSGMPLNPIQLSEIVSYLQLYGSPAMDLHIFIELLGVMDTKFLELENGNQSSGNS